MALTKIKTDGVTDDAITSGKIPANAVGSSEIADTAVTLAKLEHGTGSNDGKFLRANNGADPTFETIDLTSLSASNLTSGTVPDARISASSVQQHASSFDDNKIINDISALALKINGIQNATRYNTNSTSVETFQDGNGIASFTNASRDSAGEYISSLISETFGTLTNFVAANWNKGSLQAWSAGTATFTHDASPDEDGMGQTMGASSELSFPANTPFQWSLVAANGSGYGPYINIQLESNSDTGTVDNTTNFRNNGRRTANSIEYRLDISGNGLYSSEFNNSGTENSLVSAGGDMTSGSTTLIQRDTLGIFRIYKNGTLMSTSTHAITGAMQLAIGGTGSHSASASSMQYSVGTASSLNATGNFISNVITASASTTKMGVVITYKDHAGTATLNTDLKVSVSADNGSNFTQVTLVAQPDFATGVKMAIANDVTVTAGTQLKYKVEFANQSGSKETRVTGISLQY